MHVPRRNGEKGEMAAASSYAWPSVVVYRGVTTLMPSWRNLSRFVCIMYDITSFYNDIHIFIFFFKPTYRP